MGKEAQKLKVGDIVVIPANVKHFHGASNEWLEPVTDEEYNKLGD